MNRTCHSHHGYPLPCERCARDRRDGIQPASWIDATDAADLLEITAAEATQLAKAHAWRTTSEAGTTVYALNDVQATAQRSQRGNP